MEIIVNTQQELDAIKKQYADKFIFIPSGPGGKIYFPVEITIQ